MPSPSPEEVKPVLDSFFKADLATWELFSSRIEVRNFKKNEIIKKHNTTEQYINLLYKGSVGMFVRKEQDDICITLYYEMEFFSDYLSFLQQTNTMLQSVALEDCELWSIPYKEMMWLYSRSPGIEISRRIAENLFIRKQTEQIDLLSLTPRERYIKLIKERPNVLLRTPLKIVASYLGVTPQSLSRLRKNVSIR